MGRRLPEITKEQVVKAWGDSFDTTAHQCHAVSLALVKGKVPGLPQGSRVARGFCDGVVGQHSWVVLGDPYDSKAVIVDATLWSYIGGGQKVYVYPGYSKRYMPHGGAGTIFDVGPPPKPRGEPIKFDHGEWNKLSDSAQRFLSMIGPLDARGWHYMGNAPVHGWPSQEIIELAYSNPKMRPYIPIDIAGMRTDVNPAGVYF